MKRFECVPLRSGWVVGWWIDGARSDQIPHLRVEANTRLMLRTVDADNVVAIFGVDDGKPPRLLQLGPSKEGERAGLGSGLLQASYWCPRCGETRLIYSPCDHVQIAPSALARLRELLSDLDRP